MSDSEVKGPGELEIPEPEIFNAVQVLTQYKIGNEFRGSRETLCINSVVYLRGSIAVDAMTFAFYLWRFGPNLRVNHYGNASKVYTREDDVLIAHHECDIDEYRIFEHQENRKVV